MVVRVILNTKRKPKVNPSNVVHLLGADTNRLLGADGAVLTP